MNAAARLAGFAAVIAATFGGAMAVGAAVGPIDVCSDVPHQAAGDTVEIPRGLAVAADRYRLAVEQTNLQNGADGPFSFRILDDTGAPTTRFDELHERRLHLIVLSRNLVDYLHLHPMMDPSGRWTVDLPALQPGSYRVFADFQPSDGQNLTLGADVLVTGDVQAVELPEPATVDSIDEYEITLAGTPLVGTTELSFTVSVDGKPVRTDPYLGAAGHLVAIRSSDLAYLHVHPHEADTTPTVTFTGEFPTAGTYRLFLDFSHNDQVRTAAFTVVVPEQAEPADQGDHVSNNDSPAHDERH